MIKLKDFFQEGKLLKEFDDYGMEAMADNLEKVERELIGFAKDVKRDLDPSEMNLVKKALKDFQTFYKSYKRMYTQIN